MKIDLWTTIQGLSSTLLSFLFVYLKATTMKCFRHIVLETCLQFYQHWFGSIFYCFAHTLPLSQRIHAYRLVVDLFDLMVCEKDMCAAFLNSHTHRQCYIVCQSDSIDLVLRSKSMEFTTLFDTFVLSRTAVAAYFQLFDCRMRFANKMILIEKWNFEEKNIPTHFIYYYYTTHYRVI